jgi:hypothetical protein
MTISQEQVEVLQKIFANKDARSQLRIVCNPHTRDVVVLFTVHDPKWFESLCADLL